MMSQAPLVVAVNRFIAAAVAVLFTAATTTAQSSCSASCQGTTSDGRAYDLSALMGQDYQTVGSDQNADTYFLNVCGTSATQCPDDAGDPPVTHGMAVSTVQAGGCYVLGVSCCCCSSQIKNAQDLIPFSLFSISFPNCSVTALCLPTHHPTHSNTLVTTACGQPIQVDWTASNLSSTMVQIVCAATDHHVQ